MKNELVWVLGMASIVAAGLAGAAAPDKAVQQAAAKKATELCSACHGPGGSSISPTFPRLAGQQAMYIENQLKAFRTHTRAEPDAHDFMWGIAAPLDDKMIDGLAWYFSSQPPMHGKPADPALAEKGKDLFDKGVPSKQIPACASCHGKNGEGMGEFPRLAGQHAEYLVKQLTVIQNALRAAPVMHGIVKDLDKGEMDAVAAYLESR